MLKYFIFLPAILLLIGCASKLSDYKNVDSLGKERLDSAKKHTPKVKKKLNNVRFSSDFYVPATNPKDDLKPTWYFKNIEVTFSDFSLSDVMRDTLDKHAVNVKYLDGIDNSSKVSLSHKGSIGQFLKKLSFKLGYHFELDNDLLTWRKFLIQSFDVSFLAGKTDYFFGNKEGSSNSSSTNSSQSNEVVSETGFDNNEEYINFSSESLSVWLDLEKSLDLIKSKEGQIVINQATNTILVKDYPERVKRIEKFLVAENNKLSLMVALDFQVIEYINDSSNQRGINWSVVKQDLASGGIITLQNAFASLGSDDLAPTLLGYTQETGKYAGSQALINILDRQGVISSIKKRSIVSLSNQVSKLIDGSEIAYLARSGGTATANVGSQENLQPGILKTGDAIYILANVVGDRIIVQLSTKLTNLTNLREVESGERSIETPETARKDLFLKFSVKDGETLLISASKEHRNEYSDNSVGGLILFGGEYGGKTQTKETLVLITPRIING